MSDQYEEIAKAITSEYGNAATIFTDTGITAAKTSALSMLSLKERIAENQKHVQKLIRNHLSLFMK